MLAWQRLLRVPSCRRIHLALVGASRLTLDLHPTGIVLLGSQELSRNHDCVCSHPSSTYVLGSLMISSLSDTLSSTCLPSPYASHEIVNDDNANVLALDRPPLLQDMVGDMPRSRRTSRGTQTDNGCATLP